MGIICPLILWGLLSEAEGVLLEAWERRACAWGWRGPQATGGSAGFRTAGAAYPATPCGDSPEEQSLKEEPRVRETCARGLGVQRP